MTASSAVAVGAWSLLSSSAGGAGVATGSCLEGSSWVVSLDSASFVRSFVTSSVNGVVWVSLISSGFVVAISLELSSGGITKGQKHHLC